MKKYKITKKAIRKGEENKDKCFYCREKVGKYHLEDCVFIKRKVLVRAIIEYEVDVPNFWDEGDVEFHRNESSWCASNLIYELEELDKKENCLCGNTKFEFIKTTSGSFLDEN